MGSASGMTGILALILILAWTYIVIRARWMFARSRSLIAFGAGTGLLVVAAGLSPSAIEQTEPIRHPSYALLRLCLWLSALGAIAVVTIVARWWLAERHAGRSRSLPRTAELAHVRKAGYWANLLGDFAIVLLLPVGGLVIGVGWVTLMIVLWTSQRWTPNEKLIATVCLPGGPLVGLLAVESAASMYSPLQNGVPWLAANVMLFLASTGIAVYLVACSVRRRRIVVANRT